MAQANAHLKTKTKSPVPSAKTEAPYVSGEVAAGAASKRTEAHVRAKRGEAASAPTPVPSALPKALQGKEPLDYVTAPVSDPDAYALKVTGNCMEPLIHDGDIAIVTPGAELRRGMIVGIHFRDGSLGAIKRLAVLPSAYFFNRHPDSEVDEVLQVEQLNPPKRLMKPSSKVEKIHAVAGVLRAGEWIDLTVQP